MSQQMSAKEAGRLATAARLALRSPVTQQRVKRKLKSMARRTRAHCHNHAETQVLFDHVPAALLQSSPQLNEPEVPLPSAPHVHTLVELIGTTSSSAQFLEGRDGTLSPPQMIARDPLPAHMRIGVLHQDPVDQSKKARHRGQMKGKDKTLRAVAARKESETPHTPSEAGLSLPEENLCGQGRVHGGRGRGTNRKRKVRRGSAAGRGRPLDRERGELENSDSNPMMLRPPGWVRPEIAMGNRHSPPTLRPGTQKRRVMRNLLEVVNSGPSAHGAERLLALERDDASIYSQCETPTLRDRQLQGLSLSNRDCKEAPQQTPCSKGKGMAGMGDSATWYNSCDSDGCRSHGPGSLPDVHSLSAHHVEQTKIALVMPVVLGLSPTSNGGRAMRGEVTREFIHAVTGDEVLLVDFEGVIGVRSVAKKLCFQEGSDGAGPSAPRRREANRAVLPPCHITTTRQLLEEFDATDESLVGLTPFLVGGDVELPPLPLDMGSPLETHSPTVGVTFPDYMLPLEESASDESDGDDDVVDPDWDAEYADFACDSDAGNSDWEVYEPDVIDEVGPIQDLLLDEYSFESRYADGHWNSLETTLIGDRESFSGPEPGPTRRYGRHLLPVHEFFNLFWPESDLTVICRETNKYAGQESVERPGTLNGRGKWKILTVIELRAWFGVCILMGLKQQPTIRSYWSRRSFYGCPIIKQVMRRPRFEQILSCLHLVDNDSLVHDKKAEGYDKIGKCRWLVDSFVRRAKASYNCEKHLSCDEIMVPYRGRRCDIKQYMKNKPVKYGIKIWCCATSKTRYVYNLIVYEGRKNQKSEKDLGMKVVLKLVDDLTHFGHVVVTDRFFTSPHLADALMALGTWFTRTTKHNRVGMPSHLAQYCHLELPRGTLVVAMHQSRRMAACVWFDGCPVYLLSTSSDPMASECTCLRWVGGERLPYPTSPMQVEYHDKMRGVDVVDQCRVEYTVQVMTHKWWHRVLFFILDTSLGNAYVLYKAQWSRGRSNGQRRKPLSRADFLYDIAAWLTGPAFRLGQTGGRFNLQDYGIHECLSAGLQRKRCRLCGRKQNRYCPGCGGAFLCMGACYHKVHTEAQYAAKIWLH